MRVESSGEAAGTTVPPGGAPCPGPRGRGAPPGAAGFSGSDHRIRTVGWAVTGRPRPYLAGCDRAEGR